MRRVADRAGIRAPSIYKHFPDKHALEHTIVSTVFEKLGTSSRPRSRATIRRPVAAAYRRHAKAHPHLYRLMTEQSLERDLLAPGVEDRAGSAAHLVVTGDRDAGRAFWAFAHGMRILELNGRSLTAVHTAPPAPAISAAIA